MADSKEPNLWRYFGIGFELAGAVLVLMLIGYGIDHWLGTDPWGLVSGAIIGLAGGLYNLIKTTIRDNDDAT